VIASPEQWAKFAHDWEQILPLAPLGPDLARNFKFSEMINAGQFRIENTKAFARVIEDHVPMTLSLHLYQKDIDRAKTRVNIPPGFNLDWGVADTPYMLGLVHVVKWFTENVEEVNEALGTDQPIDFIFDARSEKKFVREAWDITVESLPPEERESFGDVPRFENDKKFLPLQAADYMAGWSRYWIERNEEPELGAEYLGGLQVEGKLLPHVTMHLTEDVITEYLIQVATKCGIPDVYDSGPEAVE
jgi:hypothetical protein